MTARLADTNTAALYLLMRRTCEPIQSFRADDVIRAKRRIYNLARDGVLTRHGGPGWGEARWDLAEIERYLRSGA